MSKLKICFVVGTRPNFVKAFPLFHKFKKASSFDIFIIHTTQHYDKRMSEIFFKNFNINDNYIKLSNKTSNVDTIMSEIENVFKKILPDWIFVFGDVNSSLAAALVAKKCNIKIAHIESGLRSFDTSMVEETNRIKIDSISDLLFITEKSALQNLKNEGIDKNRIFFVGNTMIDSIVNFKKNIFENKKIFDKYRKKNYILVTLHRPINVNNHKKLQYLIDKISSWNKDHKIIWPVHPRVKINRINFNGYWEILRPQSYINFMTLLYNCKGVFTDSGGVQEETSFFKIPCFTLRENTERPITLERGTNFLITRDYHNEEDVWKFRKKNVSSIPLWDGKASDRILSIFNNL